jgi:hypothetical protein
MNMEELLEYLNIDNTKLYRLELANGSMLIGEFLDEDKDNASDVLKSKGKLFLNPIKIETVSMIQNDELHEKTVYLQYNIDPWTNINIDNIVTADAIVDEGIIEDYLNSVVMNYYNKEQVQINPDITLNFNLDDIEYDENYSLESDNMDTKGDNVISFESYRD